MPTPIDRAEVQRLLAEQHGQLIEVLPAIEYEDEHLPDAINIPLRELDRETTRQHASATSWSGCRGRS